MLLFLHGAGERGDDNLQPVITYAGLDSFFDEEDDPAREAIVLIPQCPVGDMWVDVDASEKGMYSIESVPESAAMSAVLKLIKFTVSDLSVDTARIYAMGMSMGGYGTWDILARHTDLLAAAVPICGGCDVSRAEAIKEIPSAPFTERSTPLSRPTARARWRPLSRGRAPQIFPTPSMRTGCTIFGIARCRRRGWMTGSLLRKRMSARAEQIKKSGLRLQFR